jgi:hypothetical protein
MKTPFPTPTAGPLLGLLLWALLIAGACALSGCASIYAGELARDALARCPTVSTIDYRGGRWHDSASTAINCRPLPPAQETRHGHADR